MRFEVVLLKVLKNKKEESHLGVSYNKLLPILTIKEKKLMKMATSHYKMKGHPPITIMSTLSNNKN